MIHCWFTQMRLVIPYCGELQVKGIRNMQAVTAKEGLFVYVVPAPRGQACPAEVVQAFRNRPNFTIIRVEEPR